MQKKIKEALYQLRNNQDYVRCRMTTPSILSTSLIIAATIGKIEVNQLKYNFVKTKILTDII